MIYDYPPARTVDMSTEAVRRRKDRDLLHAELLDVIGRYPELTTNDLADTFSDVLEEISESVA